MHWHENTHTSTVAWTECKIKLKTLKKVFSLNMEQIEAFFVYSLIWSTEKDLENDADSEKINT